MARHGVTYDDIASTANQLKGQGKSVTIENVRVILGTGSIGTINKYLRQWKDTQNSIQKLPSKENLPESLAALMKGLWESLVTESSEKFMPLEEAYQHEISELKDELEKYKNNNQRWQKMFDQWQQEKTQFANEKLTLEQALEFSHIENASLNTKFDGLLQQLQEKQARIDELHRLHQQTQANLEHYRETTREQRLLDQQQFEQQKQQSFAEIKALKEETLNQRQKLTDLQYRNNSLIEAHQLLVKKNDQCQNKNEQLKAALLATERKSHEHFVLSETYEKQNKELLKTLENQSNQLINHQADNKLLSKEMTELTKELAIVKEQAKLIAQEKWQLVQEKTKLETRLEQMQKSLET